MRSRSTATVGALALLLLGVLLSAAVAPVPAAANPAGPGQLPPSEVPAAAPDAQHLAQIPPIPPGGDGLARISPDLAGVRVDSPAADAAQRGYDIALTNLQTSANTRVWAENEIVRLGQREAELTSIITEAFRARKAAAVDLADARRLLSELAVNSYIASGDHDQVTRTFDIDRTMEVGATNVLSGTVRDRVVLRADTAASALDDANDTIDTAQAERLDTRRLLGEVSALRERAAADEVRFYTEAGERRFELEQARATAVVTGTDFTLVALDAFVRAAKASGECRMPWWALAGISRVEGRHGTYGGSRLGPDGQVTVPIIGIPLSGASNTAVIGDTDGGALDGDVVWDRAVGPMQFIPSTWRRWQTDGDGDGDADPQNMYDAVGAARAYLCHNRRIDGEADLRAGYFSYNRSQTYVENVLAHAYNYSNLVIPDPPPAPPIPPSYPGAGIAVPPTAAATATEAPPPG